MRIIAPGNSTLFLKGRIASRLGNSTDSAMFATTKQQLLHTNTQSERRRREKRDGIE